MCNCNHPSAYRPKPEFVIAFAFMVSLLFRTLARQLYWVEESSKSTLKQKNTETGFERVVKDNMAKVTDMIVYAPQTGWGYCHVDKKISNQKCPGICITEPSPLEHHFEHSCVCPTHYQSGRQELFCQRGWNDFGCIQTHMLYQRLHICFLCELMLLICDRQKMALNPYNTDCRRNCATAIIRSPLYYNL